MVFITIVKANYLVTSQTLTTYALSSFGFIHEFWTIPIANMTYTRSQYYLDMVVGEHGIQMFKVVVVVFLVLLLSFDVFVSTSAHPLLFLDKWCLHVYLNFTHTSMNTHMVAIYYQGQITLVYFRYLLNIKDFLVIYMHLHLYTLTSKCM